VRKAKAKKTSAGDITSDEGFRRAIVNSDKFQKLASEVLTKLLLGAENVRRGLQHQNGTDPLDVALFLVAVACCAAPDLPMVVEKGLPRLGLTRYKPGPGRHRGSKVESLYLEWVRGAEIMDEKYKLWQQREEMKHLHPRNWQRHLRRNLATEWKGEWIDLLITSHNRGAFHINLVSRHFAKSYEAIERSLRRAMMKANKEKQVQERQQK
jgi:hypothetical protein